MKTKNNFSQNATPLLIEERDVLGQTKPSGISVLKRFKHKSKNEHKQNLQEVINHSKYHQEHKPYWKRIHHTWTFWVFIFLMFAAIMYYTGSVDFAFAPRVQSNHPTGSTPTP